MARDQTHIFPLLFDYKVLKMTKKLKLIKKIVQIRKDT